MRIPLDYFRRIGVPLDASREQIEQAYQDRRQQIPRGEYSEVALAARNQLAQEAYQTLNDVQSRSRYQGQLQKILESSGQGQVSLPVTSSELTDKSLITAGTPSLEISQGQLVGALVILQELGEFDLVWRIGRPFLNRLQRLSGIGDREAIQKDIVLTLVLSRLELGRESWRQGEYTRAAECYETGRNLAQADNCADSVLAELDGELGQLRPFQILEAVERGLEQTTEREQGLQLLEEMLDARGGINGNGDDQSQLDIDHFLRFIQQLRPWLTVEEQLDLFKREARRPSGVAAYLSVYALIAQGFTKRQPGLILEAQDRLLRLAKHQEVWLERSICSLLLGQTKEAVEALSQSQDSDTLQFVRQHSEGAPDLLPGLCLFTEKWLESEVFPYFRNLQTLEPSLKVYFAEESLQVDLDNLYVGSAAPSSRLNHPAGIVQAQGKSLNYAPTTYAATGTQAYLRNNSQQQRLSSAQNTAATGSVHGSLALADPIPYPAPKRRKRRQPISGVPKPVNSTPTPLPIVEPDISRLDSAQRTPETSAKSRNPRRSFMLLGALGLSAIAVGLLHYQSTQPITELNISLDSPAVAIPQENVEEALIENAFSATGMQSVVERWLSAKALALGKTHDTQALQGVLTENLLAQWQRRGQSYASLDWHRDFVHDVEVRSLVTDADSENRVTLEALVHEQAQHFHQGQLDQTRSYDDNLLVRYQLVNRDGEWLINGIEVLKEL